MYSPSWPVMPVIRAYLGGLREGEGIDQCLDVAQAQQLNMQSQRTGAELNSLGCEVILLSLPWHCYTAEAFSEEIYDVSDHPDVTCAAKQKRRANSINIDKIALLR